MIVEIMELKYPNLSDQMIGMKDGQKLWTREELMLAINLYCKLTFGTLHKGNSRIIELAELIGRTPSSVAFKLNNFASFDPTLKERGIKGAVNASKLDKQVWDEFYQDWDSALIESEVLLAKQKRVSLLSLNNIETYTQQEGKETERMVMARVNQAVFRNIILATYNNSCCITGINNTELLIASHIVPWSKDEKNRLNPMNGICLNALHDKAFDKGLLTISAEDYTIKISSKLKTKTTSQNIDFNFLYAEGNEIILPGKFLPSRALLKIHNNFFKP